MQTESSPFEDLKASGIKHYEHAVEILHHLNLTPHPTNFLNTERLPYPETSVQLLKPWIVESNKWAHSFESIISHLQSGFEAEQRILDSNKLKEALKSQNFASEKFPWRQMQLHYNSALDTQKLEQFFIAFYLGLLLADFSSPVDFPKDNANFTPMNLSIPSSISDTENSDIVVVKFTSLASHDLRTKSQVENFSQLFNLVSLDEDSQRKMASYCDSLLALITTILMQKHEILKRCSQKSFSYFEPTTIDNKSGQNPYLLQIFEDLRDLHTIVSQLKTNFAPGIGSQYSDSGFGQDPFPALSLSREDKRRLLLQKQAYARNFDRWDDSE